MRHSSTRGTGHDERAQSALDFLLGASIFLSALTLLIFSNPFLFFPDGISGTDTTNTASAGASELAQLQFNSDQGAGADISEIQDFYSAIDEDDNQDVTDNINSIPDSYQAQVQIRHIDPYSDPPDWLTDLDGNIENRTADSGDDTAILGNAVDSPSSEATQKVNINGFIYEIYVTTHEP